MIVKERYDALLIARYFLGKSIRGYEVTNLKLQKILFYAQSLHYNLKGDLLFNNKIKVVRTGISVEGVMEKYKSFNYSEIEDNFNKEDFEELTIETKVFLDKIWETFKRYSGKQLEYLVSKEDFYVRAETNNSFGQYVDITQETSYALKGMIIKDNTKDSVEIEDERLDLISKVYSDN